LFLYFASINSYALFGVWGVAESEKTNVIKEGEAEEKIVALSLILQSFNFSPFFLKSRSKPLGQALNKGLHGKKQCWEELLK
jgi:hypothetical protein